MTELKIDAFVGIEFHQVVSHIGHIGVVGKRNQKGVENQVLVSHLHPKTQNRIGIVAQKRGFFISYHAKTHIQHWGYSESKGLPGQVKNRTQT